ncbi:CDP-glycerol glycerophosphotransferase family protein [Candidatus Stoquefichus massiliensis]|uniref:CDP-glycerol glycerophosphotransferase family protein n=1 Tax=Candidatus Stoquefichus massiliensis TaxID=1470350 RepID=UPI000487F772|nr:CDP-glycerol glycerophosphotransferase family protein [Candidatus Stoquefichus massiliensis]
MGVQKIILNFILTIESFIVSLFPIKSNKVTFVSLESDHLTSDLKLIYDQLNSNEFDIHLCLIKYHKDLWGQFLYFINCMKQLYFINTSKIVLLHDNNYVVSHFKRKGVTVIQVWHACGAIKKFGNVIKREYPIANYDYALATSSFWQNAYSQAFSIPAAHVLPIGLPRTDELFANDWLEDRKNELYHKYPILKDKQIILYAPTFRGNIYKGFSAIPFDVLKIMKRLPENYVLLYKFHPLMGNYQLAEHERVFNMNHEDTHALFSISDYLISDYSSIVFDYMILEKNLLFFVPDLAEYSRTLGVFVDLNDLKCPICQNEDELLNHILSNAYDNNHHMHELKNIFFNQQDGKSTERVVEFMKEIVNDKGN